MQKIAFIGDSITQGGLYISYINEYFKRHFENSDMEFINVGKSSETASGLSEDDHPFPRPCIHERIDNILKLIDFDTAVICYGLNDAIYHPFDEERFSLYQNGILSLVSKLKSSGKNVILMTPTPFDKHTFTAVGGILKDKDFDNFSYTQPFEDYDDVMQKYSQWILSLDEQTIDIYNPLRNYLDEMIATDKDFTSGDGIHPNNHGNWIISKVILKHLFNLTLTHEPNFVNSGEFVKYYDELSAYYRGCIDEGTEPFEKPQYKPCTYPFETWISSYNGYNRINFYANGREGCVISPKTSTAKKYYVWRCEFLGAFDSVDLALLEKGFYLVYYTICDMYGSPKAVKLMEKFQNYITKEFGLYEKAILIGMSRGGLYAMNFANANPDRVSLIYFDAPVLNIFSWPGNGGRLGGSPNEWEECKREYHITGSEEQEYKNKIAENIAGLIKYNIPMVLVAGGSDEVVAFDENGKIMSDIFKVNNVPFKEIIKPTCLHHPHSLDDPKEIIEYILANMKG